MKENSDNNNYSEEDYSARHFIDPMFAIIIAAAVNETFVDWVKNNNMPSVFELSIALVGFMNVLLSWFGYHKSVYNKPIKGMLRFLITVTLLPLYLFTIILFNSDFFKVCIVYSIVFFLWSLWEYFKDLEYSTKEGGFWYFQFQWFNLLVYGVTSLIYIFNYVDPNNIYIPIGNWLALIILIFSILSLRIEKTPNRSAANSLSKIKEGISSLCLGPKN